MYLELQQQQQSEQYKHNHVFRAWIDSWTAYIWDPAAVIIYIIYIAFAFEIYGNAKCFEKD